MSRLTLDAPASSRPSASAALELLKPITWFAPMWAFGCGAISARSSAPADAATVWTVLAGIVLAGPLLCGASQAVNDWFDRHVDAINEPQRPIPSGRMPGRSGLYMAIGWTGLSLLIAVSARPGRGSLRRLSAACSPGPTARRPSG